MSRSLLNLRTEQRRLPGRRENHVGQDKVPNAGAKEPPMTKRTERAGRTQAENGAGREPAQLVEPMLAGMTTTRQHLLAWVHAQGLAALDELFREEAVALAGRSATATL